MLRWAKERLEWIVALLVVVDMLREISTAAREQAPSFLNGFRTHNLIILECSLVLAILLLFAFMLRDRADRKTAVELVKANRLLQRENSSLCEFKEKFDSCGQTYRTYARANAECDWQLFHALFLDFAERPDEALRPDLRTAITASRLNIRQVLDVAAEVMSIHTGIKCAACIQVVDPKESVDFASASVYTIDRDRDSKTERAVDNDGKHTVRENTLHQRIFVQREPFALVNDLATLKAADPTFRTTSQAFPRVYNALFIVPLPNVADFRQPDDQLKAGSEPRATLCLDSLIGRFNEGLHLKILQELAWRLAVMLYRTERLGYMQERLG